MDHNDAVWTTVAQCIEQLRLNVSTPQHRETILKGFLDLISNNEDARTAASCHPQSIPVLITILRSDFATTKNLAAMVIEILSRDDETRIKVLLGGSIPSLLVLLKSGQSETQIVAAKVLYTISKGSNGDKVGPKIFSTEGTVPCLWEYLKTTQKIPKSLDGILTGILRNLSTDAEGFWEATEEADGLDIILKLIYSGSTDAQCHSCYLLSKMMLAQESSCFKVLESGCVDRLLKLLSRGNDFKLRAEAAGALRALTQVKEESRRLIVNSNGIPLLISATVAPWKEGMSGEVGQNLQENAMGALANISGGLDSIIYEMAESIQTRKSNLNVADTLGALASAIMVFDEKERSKSLVDPLELEEIIVEQIRLHGSGLIQERATETLASLYGNKHLARYIAYPEVKKILVALITMTAYDTQSQFLEWLITLSTTGNDVWHAINQRQGVQLLISLLGVSTEEQQECAVALLSIISQENDESKWAITAGGGIPPFVQILESGSIKAKEDCAIVLGNLCSHSEDIRSCVEKAGAVPALLWLLKNAYLKGQEIAAKTLKHMVSKSDSTTISQLNAMLAGETPGSKRFVSETLGHFLSVSPLAEILFEGSPANEAFQALSKMLSSFKEEPQQQAATAFAKILKDRKDLCESPTAAELIVPLQKILIVRNEKVAMQAAQCLAALFDSAGMNPELEEAAPKIMTPLLRLCLSNDVQVIENAISALANMFSNGEICRKVNAGDIIQPLTRVLREGTLEGKAQAAKAVSRLLESHTIDDTMVEKFQQFGTVLAAVAVLGTTSIEDNATDEAIQALALFVKLDSEESSSQPFWSELAKAPQTTSPLVNCLALGKDSVQEKAIYILSKLSKHQSKSLADKIVGLPRCITALTGRIIESSNIEEKTGAATLLVCTAKEHRHLTISTLIEEKCLSDLVTVLVKMLGSELDDPTPIDDMRKGQFLLQNQDSPIESKVEALWMLSIVASYNDDTKYIVTEASTIDTVIEILRSHNYNAQNEIGTKSVGALLLAILFQDKDVLRLAAVNRTIPILATLLKSSDPSEKYFASQAIASLVFTGDRSTMLAVANSGAAMGLISVLGSTDLENSKFLDIANEFMLVRNPAETALEHLFRADDIKRGSTSRKAIPALIELLTPSSERPNAPIFAEGLLTLLAMGNHTNKLTMADAGVLEALTRYLSLGPQANMEECTADLFKILFTSSEIRCHSSAIGALEQLVALLRLGGKSARYSASRALQELFKADHIKNNDAARQAIPPLLEMLRTGSEKEQRISLKTLSTLSYDNQPKAMVIADPETRCLEFLSKMLWDECSLELKEEAAGLCFSVLSFSRVRAIPAAVFCLEPLVIVAGDRRARPIWLTVLHALNNAFESASLAGTAIRHGVVRVLVTMLTDEDESLYEVTLSSLVKLVKANNHCIVDIEDYGVVKKLFHILPSLSDSGCASAAELLQILLTNANSSIADEVPTSTMVDAVLSILSRPGLSIAGQYSSMQVLMCSLGNSQDLASYKISPKQPINHLIALLESPSQQVQQLASELFSHLLVERQLDQSMITKKVVSSLIQLAATGEQKAIFSLETASTVLPQDVAEAGGILEVSNVIVQLDPLPPHGLWESAASVVRNILESNRMYYWHVPVEVFVRMLQSDNTDTILVSLQGMLALVREEVAYAEAFAKSGAVDALTDLLTCYQSEEVTAQVLEALVNDKIVRKMKTTFAAVAPLANYLLDPNSKNRPARLLSALALGDLFQEPGVPASSNDVVLACQSLISVLESHPKEDMKTVALCALQNVIVNGRANRKALAEAGAVNLVQSYLLSNNVETARQAAGLAKVLFSTATIHEQASTDIISTLSVALENDLRQGTSVNGDIIKALLALFTSSPKVLTTETATACIPNLTRALRDGSPVVQDAVLDIFCLFRQAWTGITKDLANGQAMSMAEAIPALQGLIKSGKTKFQERVVTLLLCLPGSLIVTIKQGKNLKQKSGSTNAFCKLTLGNGPPKETKVVSNSTCPEWNQGFSWPFDNAPRGQKVQITCKNKSTFSKATLGKVTIQVDRVIAEGTITREYALIPDKNKDGTTKKLEIEITWTHR